MRKIILIGGAPTTGKSEMARMLSKHLSLPWISTDQLREIMKSCADESKFPTLFDTVNVTAEEFLAKYTPQEIADMEYEQGDDVWHGVKGLVNCRSDWKDGFILEGVNILPHLVNRDYASDEEVQAVFLIDEDQDRMRDVIYSRGLYDSADKYSDDLKEKEVEWATLFTKKLKKECEIHKFPVVEVSKNKDDMFRVLEDLSEKQF